MQTEFKINGAEAQPLQDGRPQGANPFGRLFYMGSRNGFTFNIGSRWRIGIGTVAIKIGEITILVSKIINNCYLIDAAVNIFVDLAGFYTTMIFILIPK